MTNIEEKFRNEETEYIQNLIRTNALNDEVKVVAIKVLKERNATVPVEETLDEAEARYAHSRNIKPGLLLRLSRFVVFCVKGEAPLVSAYWGLGVLLFCVLVLLGIGYEATRLTIFLSVFQYGLALTFWGGILFHSFCVWRCRANTESHVFKTLVSFFAVAQIAFWGVGIPIFMLIGAFTEH